VGVGVYLQHLNTFNSAILLIVYFNNPFNTFDADKGIS